MNEVWHVLRGDLELHYRQTRYALEVANVYGQDRKSEGQSRHTDEQIRVRMITPRFRCSALILPANSAVSLVCQIREQLVWERLTAKTHTTPSCPVEHTGGRGSIRLLLIPRDEGCR